MTDPHDVKRRIGAMIARIERRDAYGSLLADGTIVVDREAADDPQTWRSELRRHARADHLKIRTGETNEIVWAWLCEVDTKIRREESQRVHRLVSHVMPLASAHRHEPETALRDGLEVIVICQRCEAVGYLDAGAQLAAGDIFDADCPHDGPPRETTLAFASELPLWPADGDSGSSHH